jgi:hypothetical protein
MINTCTEISDLAKQKLNSRLPMHGKLEAQAQAQKREMLSLILKCFGQFLPAQTEIGVHSHFKLSSVSALVPLAIGNLSSCDRHSNVRDVRYQHACQRARLRLGNV